MHGELLKLGIELIRKSKRPLPCSEGPYTIEGPAPGVNQGLFVLEIDLSRG